MKNNSAGLFSVQRNAGHKKIHIFLSALLITALGFTVYANSFNGKFIWDDDYLVKDNIYIRSWARLPEIFTKDTIAVSTIKFSFYRPLQILSYNLDYSLWKLKTIGYHFTNILLHVLVALSIFWLINILSNNVLLSLLTSSLFVVHPIHTEAISYISGRADPLAALFLLLSFIFYIKYINTSNVLSYIIVLLCFILALLSKELSLILLGILVLYRYSYGKKLKLSLFLCLIAVVYIGLRATIFRPPVSHAALYPTTFLQRLPGFLVAFCGYIRLLFLPFGLHMEYGSGLFKISNPQSLLGMLLLLATIIWAYREKNKNKLIFFAIGWFLLTLFPQSNLFPINAYMAEHWLYLPSIGFFLVIGSFFERWYRLKNSRVLSVVIFAILISFYSFLTIKQNDYWKEPKFFYQTTLKYSPDSWRVLNNLGNNYKELNKYEEALELYEKAIVLNPAYAEAYGNIAFIYEKMGKNEDALAMYKKALEVGENVIGIYNNLGIFYYNLGKFNEAIAVYHKAIETRPDYPDTYNNFGNVYEKINKLNEAAASYLKAIELKPDYAEAYYNLANLYSSVGNNEKAVDSYQKAIEADPNLVKAYNNLGLIFHSLGKYEDAIISYKKATELGPKYVKAYNNLGNSYQAMNKHEEAISAYKRAIELNPNYAEAYNNLAVAYYYNKQYDLANQYCNKAIELGAKVNQQLLELLTHTENRKIGVRPQL